MAPRTRSRKSVSEEDSVEILSLNVATPIQEDATEAKDLAQDSLDLLFKALAEETQAKPQDEESEFEKIQKQIELLPKIETDLEASMKKASEVRKLGSLIVRVDDPVKAVRKTKKDEKMDSGAEWFNMKRPEMTPELKRDLLILKNRSVLDPKRHYKKEKWEIPKFFHTGTIIEGNTEFYSARLTKKQRGKTLAEEIMKDTSTTEYFQRKYSEIKKAKEKGGKAYREKLKAKKRGY